jgi:hypothetical protein
MPPVITPPFAPSITAATIYNLAARLYTKYCDQVGGVAFNGDPLPSWDQFSNDPKKQKQMHAWVGAAQEAVVVLGNYLHRETGEMIHGEALVVDPKTSLVPIVPCKKCSDAGYRNILAIYDSPDGPLCMGCAQNVLNGSPDAATRCRGCGALIPLNPDRYSSMCQSCDERMSQEAFHQQKG